MHGATHSVLAMCSDIGKFESVRAKKARKALNDLLRQEDDTYYDEKREQWGSESVYTLEEANEIANKQHRYRLFTFSNFLTDKTVEGVAGDLDREADRLAKEWFADYRVALKALSDERRAVYDEIKGMSPEVQEIEIKRPRVRTEETETADGDKLETRIRHLMVDADGNFPVGSLNSWEIGVLDREMARDGFQAWYRNPARPSADALSVAYRNAQDHWRRMCPDFIFFHGEDDEVKVSIVDPHGHHLADSLPKLRGLADFG